MNNLSGKIAILMYALLLVLCVVTASPDRVDKGNVAPSSELVTNPSPVSQQPAILPTVPTPQSANLNITAKIEVTRLDKNFENAQRELPLQPGNGWGNFCFLLIVLVAELLVLVLVPPHSKVYLAICYALSALLYFIPILWLSSIGLVGLLASTGFLFHHTTPKHLAENSVFVGIGLAFLAYAFAVAGGLASHQEMESLERYSTAFYEATQLPLMNMSTHDDVTDPDAKLYFTLARIFGCLFAYYVAFSAVLYVCERAKAQWLLSWYGLPSKNRLALVFGLGTVGRRLIRNLIKENFRVIAIESDQDSVHIGRARELGAGVIVGDALDNGVYKKIPFDAVASIYVVAGEDRLNLEISQQLLTYSSHRVEQRNKRISKDAPWWSRISENICRKVYHDTKAVCHVQLYDSNMQRLMDQVHFRQSIERSHIEMRHFNAQQNAVRDLIQRELSKPGIRPGTNAENEVGLYLLVGFEELGQEVALGLAHLAHFENFKRSRIVIFCDNPELDSSRFLARYPKFTPMKDFETDWDHVGFDSRQDAWDHHDDHDGNHDDQNHNRPEPRAKSGVNFATNTIFTKEPSSPSDDAFLELIDRLATESGDVAAKPCMIVCNKDASQSFAWASEFVDAWRSFCRRNDLQPECPTGKQRPSLTTYFWLQGHKALRKVVNDSERLVPFGLEENCLSTTALDATLLMQLGSVVQYSYSLATSTSRMNSEKNSILEPLKFEFLQSNLQAAAHSLIKYQVAGRKIDTILAKGDVALPKLGTVDQFSLDGHNYSDPLSVAEVNDGVLMKIGKMEHNRWMAEQLLKGYVYVAKEAERGVDGKRLPQHEHERATLCPWEQLSEEEKLKDLRQAYYVLYHLKVLDSMHAPEPSK